MAILYQAGLADDGDNADRRFLSVCVAEVQILTESKMHRLLEPVVDGDVIGVEVGAVKVVQDRIEPASQDWHMTRFVREDDSAAIDSSVNSTSSSPSTGFQMLSMCAAKPFVATKTVIGN